jgi:hypothetical protein
VNDEPDPPRQRVLRSRRGRRAQLTPAPDTIAEPTASDEEGQDAPPSAEGEASGPNDERMRREKPPHY